MYYVLSFTLDTFPVDACSVEPYVVDETSLVFMRFNGRDIGSIECRQMQFTTPHSWFYNYKLFMKMVYFESPDCSIYLRCMSNQDDYWACCDEDVTIFTKFKRNKHKN